MVERLFLAVLWGCLWFVIVVFPDHTHLLFFNMGVNRKATSWVKPFFGNRNQSVLIEEKPSPSISVLPSVHKHLYWGPTYSLLI